MHRQPDKVNLSFSLVYQLRKTLNLIAQDEEQFRLWVDTLKTLIKKEVDEESAYAALPHICDIMPLYSRLHRPSYAESIWKYFGNKTALTMDEVIQLMHKLNMRPTKTYAEEMLRIVDANGDGLLQVGSFNICRVCFMFITAWPLSQYDECLQLLRVLRQRAELHELFTKYATNGEYLTPRQFHRFLHREQKVNNSFISMILSY